MIDRLRKVAEAVGRTLSVVPRDGTVVPCRANGSESSAWG